MLFVLIIIFLTLSFIGALFVLFLFACIRSAQINRFLESETGILWWERNKKDSLVGSCLSKSLIQTSHIPGKSE
jgi:hypothetical protein